MTDFTPKDMVMNWVYFCEEHEVSIGEPCCADAKKLGWFNTYS